MFSRAVVKVDGDVDVAGMVEEDHQNVCVRCPHHTGLAPPFDSLSEVQDNSAVCLLLVGPQCKDLRSLDLLQIKKLNTTT